MWYVMFVHVCVCVSGLKVEFNLWYCYQFHGAGGLFGRSTAALTYLCQCAGMHVDCFSLSVCCICVCLLVPKTVCVRGETLCGRRECEKLGVLTALEQFQYSAGAGGVWTFGRAVGVRIGSVEEWTGGDELRGRVSSQSAPRPQK